jgi:hypothetical protein
MYTNKYYQTKKQLVDDLKAGVKIGVFQPNDMFGKTDQVQTGTHTVYLEGPHYPQPHKWYAQATVVNGQITKVK